MDYVELFVEKLKDKFPNGVKLYHITRNENVKSILSKGLLTSITDCGFLHTTLGEFDYGRLTTNSEGYSVIEITITPEDYCRLSVEEASYWDDECSECEDVDEREHILIKNYMDAHPNLVGGDITLYDDVEADKLRHINKDGVDLISAFPFSNIVVKKNSKN